MLSIGTDGGVRASEEGTPLLAKGAYKVQVRIVSTSDEAFSDLRVWLVLRDGAEIHVPFAFSDVAPHEDLVHTHYFALGDIKDPEHVRIQFLDASGRWWQRTSGRPLEELKRGPQQIPEREGVCWATTAPGLRGPDGDMWLPVEPRVVVADNSQTFLRPRVRVGVTR